MQLALQFQVALQFLLSVVVFGVLTFAYIAVGASAGLGGGGSKVRNRGRFIIGIGIVYAVAVLLFGSQTFIYASVIAFITVLVSSVLQR